jgi:general stress protein 13
VDLKIGQVLKGTVSGVQDYGVFVSFDSQTQGLIHISECKEGIVKNIHDEFEIGQVIDVVVLDIDPYNNSVSLSAKQGGNISNLPPQPLKQTPKLKRTFWTRSNLKIGFKTIDDNMKPMKEEALERISQKY